MERILTTGTSIIDFSRINKNGIINCGHLNKPAGSILYGSTEIVHTIDGKEYRSSGWVEWCVGADFRLDRLDDAVSFELNKDAKILRAETVEQYEDIIDKYSLIDNDSGLNKPYLDFVKIFSEYDVFHLSEGVFLYFRMANLFYSFEEYEYIPDTYSYDCETWIIANPDAINKDSILHVTNIKEMEGEY